jgi:hypothetical protein
MSDDDFKYLCAMSSGWGGTSDREKWFAGRYEYQYSKRAIGEDSYCDGAPLWDWKRAYWVSDRRADLILFTSYLRAKNEPYEVLWDMEAEAAAGTQCAYVVLTNYET